MLKNPRREFRHFVERYSPSDCIPCFSLFTVLELRRAPPIYESFLDHFSVLPCLFLKGYEQFLEEEIEQYPELGDINPALVSPYSIQIPDRVPRRDVLAQLLSDPAVRQKETKWKRERPEILNGMVQLTTNFPPEDGVYSKTRVMEFVKEASFQQLCMRSPEFVKGVLDKGEDINIDCFRSVKTMSFTVFYKFYPDRRRPRHSDVFDILITAAAPYIDVFVTELHQADCLRRTQELVPFLDHLEVETVRTLR